MYTMSVNRPGPLQPVLISQVTGKKYPDTKAGRDAIDKDEGRKKLYNDQLEAMIVLMAAYRIAKRAVPVLTPFGKKTGSGRMLAAAVGLLGKAVYSMCGKVAVNQFRTIENNTRGASISVSASKLPGMVNIESEYLQVIFDRALEACEMYCTESCEASKQCLLREAFEQVPMMGDIPRGAGQDECPYRGVRLEGAKV